MPLADYHPCNRQFASSPDEAPTDILATERQSLPVLHWLRLLSCNARWHHRHTAQMVPADTSPPSIDQRHSARTDWLTGGWQLHLAEFPSHAGATGRLPLAPALLTNAQCRELPTCRWHASLPPVSVDLVRCYRKSF